MKYPYELLVEPSPKRVRAMVGDEVVADSLNVKLLLEAGRLPVYYFPQTDVHMELLQSGSIEQVAGKGLTKRWTLRVGERRTEDAACRRRPLPNCRGTWHFAGKRSIAGTRRMNNSSAIHVIPTIASTCANRFVS